MKAHVQMRGAQKEACPCREFQQSEVGPGTLRKSTLKSFEGRKQAGEYSKRKLTSTAKNHANPWLRIHAHAICAKNCSSLLACCSKLCIRIHDPRAKKKHSARQGKQASCICARPRGLNFCWPPPLWLAPPQPEFLTVLSFDIGVLQSTSSKSCGGTKNDSSHSRNLLQPGGRRQRAQKDLMEKALEQGPKPSSRIRASSSPFRPSPVFSERKYLEAVAAK